MQRIFEHCAIPLSCVAAAVLCVIALSQSALLLVDSPYDIYIPLTAGLRWIEGALPSRDYPSPIGLLYSVVHGLALLPDSTDARSIVRADVAMLALNYLLLWPVARGLPRGTRAIIVILLAGLLMTPLALDTAWRSYRYVADYNRWAWGLFSVSVVWSFNPRARNWLSHLAVTLALCFLLYLKLTFFCGAVLMTASGRLQGRPWRDFAIPVVALALAVIIGSATGIFLPYLRDNIDIARATGSLRLGKLILQGTSPYNVMSTFLAFIVCAFPKLPGRLRIQIITSTLLIHLVALQDFDIMVPVIGLPLLLIAPQLGQARIGWLRPFLVQASAACQAIWLFGVAMLALSWQSHIAGVVMARPIGLPGTLGERLTMSTEPSTEFGSGRGDLPYADDVIYHDIEAGLSLLSALPINTRVMTLEASNIALATWPRLRPATGGLLWYDYRRSFSDEFYPPAGVVFAGADVALVPLHFTMDNTRRLVALYQPWLDRCASVITANDLWRLYRLTTSDDNDCHILTRP